MATQVEASRTNQQTGTLPGVETSVRALLNQQQVRIQELQQRISELTRQNLQEGQTHDRELFSERRQREALAEQLTASQARCRGLEEEVGRLRQEQERNGQQIALVREQVAVLERSLLLERGEVLRLMQLLEQSDLRTRELMERIRGLEATQREVLANVQSRSFGETVITEAITEAIRVADGIFELLGFKPRPDYRG